VPIRQESLPQRKLTEIRYLSGGQNRALTSSVSVLCQTKGLRDSARLRPDWGYSLTPVIIFEVAQLLRKYPVFNASYKDRAAHYYETVNIGFAIDAEKGLSIPVIPKADHKTVEEIAGLTLDALRRYIEGNLNTKDIAQGTFTITDLSAEGVLGIRPLINYCQCAILALGGEFSLPGARAGIYELSLTFDHRLTEGRAAAIFLRELKERLETYENANP
jgi:pyruvate/2-oxoglutarate dehydrogenase complex dihydrolipoamide acyltransferase (E2) component